MIHFAWDQNRHHKLSVALWKPALWLMGMKIITQGRCPRLFSYIKIIFSHFFKNTLHIHIHPCWDANLSALQHILSAHMMNMYFCCCFLLNRDSIKVAVSEPGKTYIWKEQGYTSCSASCLGGVEELIINCVREDTGKVVSPFLCSPETKPEARIRTCNDRPCPPRWNYSDFSPCSKSCGIGIRERGVSFNRFVGLKFEYYSYKLDII